MKNMFFVGDNLEVMQTDTFKSKVASVDMIYIDPPYNTKKTFSYSDKKDTSDWTQFMNFFCWKSIKKINNLSFCDSILHTNTPHKSYSNVISRKMSTLFPICTERVL